MFAERPRLEGIRLNADDSRIRYVASAGLFPAFQHCVHHQLFFPACLGARLNASFVGSGRLFWP